MNTLPPGKPNTLGKNNRKTILDVLRAGKNMTVSDLSVSAGLSKTTIMKGLEYFRRKGLVDSGGKGGSKAEGGKKPGLYRFNASYAYIFSAQIYSDELYSVLTDLQANILCSTRYKLKEDQDIGFIVDTIVESASKLMEQQGITPEDVLSMVIGSHGITNTDEGIVISSPHFPSWGNNVPLKKLIRRKAPWNMDIFIDNALRFQAYAEGKRGKGKGKKSIVVLDGGVNGLGSGVVSGGAIKRGSHFLCGEIGHIIVNPDETDECVCGGKGCFEEEIAVDKIIQRAVQLKDMYPDSQIFHGASADDINIRDVFDASNNGDTLGIFLILEVIKWFTIGLLNITLVYDPDLIIIQGVYAHAGELFRSSLEDEINQRSILQIRKKVSILYSELGDDRGVAGAALYMIDRFFRKKQIYSD